MGHRHQVISCTFAPSVDKLPDWFKHKYSDRIDFTGDYWNSYDECKMHTTLVSFNEDTQKVLIELDYNHSVVLLYHSDDNSYYDIDVVHFRISKEGITETRLQAEEN